MENLVLLLDFPTRIYPFGIMQKLYTNLINKPPMLSASLKSEQHRGCLLNCTKLLYLLSFCQKFTNLFFGNHIVRDVRKFHQWHIHKKRINAPLIEIIG
jgi:hypothetical protein